MDSGATVKSLRVPLIEEIETELSPLEAFECIKDGRFSFFLDSGMDPNRLGRYSFIGSDPFLVLSTRGTEGILTQAAAKSRYTGNPFEILQRLLAIYRLDSAPSPVPFVGGAVGYLSYDLCHFIERLPGKALDDLTLPECYFGFYDLVLAFDNLKGRTYIISSGFPELRETERTTMAVSRIDEIKNKLARS